MSHFINLSVGPAKVNKVKIFSGLCYIIKRVLTLVSGAQESVLVTFIGQNKVKIFLFGQNFDCKFKRFVVKIGGEEPYFGRSLLQIRLSDQFMSAIFFLGEYDGYLKKNDAFLS